MSTPCSKWYLFIGLCGTWAPQILPSNNWCDLKRKFEQFCPCTTTSLHLLYTYATTMSLLSGIWWMWCRFLGMELLKGIIWFIVLVQKLHSWVHWKGYSTGGQIEERQQNSSHHCTDRHNKPTLTRAQQHDLITSSRIISHSFTVKSFMNCCLFAV